MKFSPYTVFQVPLASVFSVFPELEQIWTAWHGRWKKLCTNHDVREQFDASIDEQQKILFMEAQRLPDIEKYQRMERTPTGFPISKPVADGWLINRGKIASRRLALTPHFEQRGIFWYPPKGFREWHSNHPYNRKTDIPGWRIYLVDVEEEGKSSFNFLDRNGTFTRCLDRKLHANIFYLPKEKFFWHSVVSHTDRFSCGFVPFPHATERLELFLTSESWFQAGS